MEPYSAARPQYLFQPEARKRAVFHWNKCHAILIGKTPHALVQFTLGENSILKHNIIFYFFTGYRTLKMGGVTFSHHTVSSYDPKCRIK